MKQHENKNERHRSQYTCRGFLVVDEASEDLMPIHVENYNDYYEEELAVQVCHRGILSGDVRLVLGLESTDQGRYGVADALRYHVDQSKHIHNYDLRAEVFSFAQAELVLRGSTESISRHENEELKGTPQEALHHRTWNTKFEELAEAIQRRPGPLQPHIFVNILRIHRNPKVTDDHVHYESDVRGNSSSQKAPLELDNENIAAKYLDATCDELGHHRYASVVLSRQEALCGIKLGHGPYSRHAENAVLYRQLGDISILLEEGNENFICKESQDRSWNNHEQSVDQTGYVQILPTKLAHLISKPLCLFEVE